MVEVPETPVLDEDGGRRIEREADAGISPGTRNDKLRDSALEDSDRFPAVGEFDAPPVRLDVSARIVGELEYRLDGEDPCLPCRRNPS